VRGLLREARQAARGLLRDPGFSAVDRVVSLEQLLARSVAEPRFYAGLLGAFATLALALALVGVYGVTAYSVSRRSAEIGLRVALGAGRRDVLRLVLGEGLALVAVGVLGGVAAAYGLTRLLSSLLHEVSPNDPAVFAGVSALFLAAALLAGYVPARRALRLDPMATLRTS
jgi:ABC-type antimicrobial peptide transport system permease subunit